MSNYAPAAEAAIQVIEFMAEEKAAVGITDICQGTGLNSNMVFRILNTLEKSGWIYDVNRKYALTLRPFRYASTALMHTTLQSAALSPLQTLWNTVGESTYLGVLDGDRVLYTQHLDGRGDVRVAGRVGGRYVLHATAPGKILLAHADPAVITAYCATQLTMRTPNTITTPAAMQEELHWIREHGYALDREEYGKGIVCVAGPVYDAAETVIASIGCSAYMVDDMETIFARLLPPIWQACRDTSLCLGYTGSAFASIEPHTV